MMLRMNVVAHVITLATKLYGFACVHLVLFALQLSTTTVDDVLCFCDNSLAP